MFNPLRAVKNRNKLYVLSLFVILCGGLTIVFLYFLLPNIRKNECNSELIGHWRLDGDCKDYSGRNNHGINHGVNFINKGPEGKHGGAANFNGIDAYIEIPNNPSLDFGSDDFSISIWVYTEDALKDVLGDIISKFDPDKRKGFNFTIMNFAATPNSQSNYRNILFGIDDARLSPDFEDCGAPGKSIFIPSLVVYKGNLYAGTFEWGKNQSGHVFKYLGDKKWEDCGSPDKCTTVSTLAVYNGELYAGVSRYDGTGSGLPPSPNKHPGGKIYRWEGQKRWINTGQLENTETGKALGVGGLAVFNGKLYATSLYRAGKGLYRYEGDGHWGYCGKYNNQRPVHLSVFNGHMYLGSFDYKAGISRYDNEKEFIWCGTPQNVWQIYGFMAYQGRLHVSTWPRSEVFFYEGKTNWKSCGRLGNEWESMGMMVYNGKLYAGSLPLAKVFRYDGNKVWTSIRRLDFTPDKYLNPNPRLRMRRVYSMAVFKGKLYCGLLPSGKVKSIEAGKSVTYDYELEPGWRHVVGVKKVKRIYLYVDGKMVASSSKLDPDNYDITTSTPLYIGFGQHDYFNGKMHDVRMYHRALTESEINNLYDLNLIGQQKIFKMEK